MADDVALHRLCCKQANHQRDRRCELLPICVVAHGRTTCSRRTAWARCGDVSAIATVTAEAIIDTRTGTRNLKRSFPSVMRPSVCCRRPTNVRSVNRRAGGRRRRDDQARPALRGHASLPTATRKQAPDTASPSTPRRHRHRCGDYPSGHTPAGAGTIGKLARPSGNDCSIVNMSLLPLPVPPIVIVLPSTVTDRL